MHSSTPEDPFDALLTLEDTLYTTAHAQGVADGARAGRIEGRIFGLEKGFEKFAGLGELHGRSAVWAGRLPLLAGLAGVGFGEEKEEQGQEQEKEAEVEVVTPLPALPSNPRLRNNITLLHSLTDTLTFSTSNTEEAVADFDDRLKRAGAKAKVIERIIGENDAASAAASRSRSGDGGSPTRGKRGPVRIAAAGRTEKKGDDNIEDFVGSKLLR